MLALYAVISLVYLSLKARNKAILNKLGSIKYNLWFLELSPTLVLNQGFSPNTVRCIWWHGNVEIYMVAWNNLGFLWCTEWIPHSVHYLVLLSGCGLDLNWNLIYRNLNAFFIFSYASFCNLSKSFIFICDWRLFQCNDLNFLVKGNWTRRMKLEVIR